MVTLIIFAIIGFIVGILFWNDSFGFTDGCLNFIGGIFVSLLFAVVGFLVGALVAVCIPSKTEIKCTKTIEIVSLQDNNSTKGNFFLGSGIIEGKMKYVFYYKIDSINFKMNQIDYNDVTIQYSDGAPKVETYSHVPTDAYINKFSINIPDDKYVIYVPTGTIKTNFTLDAQ